MDTTVAVNLAAWIGCAAFVVMFANGVLKLTDRLKGKKPKPPNETLDNTQRELARRLELLESHSGRLMTQEQCNLSHQGITRQVNEHGTQIEKIWATIRDERVNIEQSARGRSDKIYAQIETTRKELTDAITGTQHEMRKGFQDLERAIGRLEGRVAE